ncbi:ABC transporter substrate-binding protein [Candidatus Methylospira mobilis]
MLEALNAGKLDYATTGETPPVFAQAARHSTLVYVGQERPSPRSEAILLPEHSGISAPVELKGRKVAIAKGSNAHYLLISALAKAGLGVKNIQPVYLNPSDARAAFVMVNKNRTPVFRQRFYKIPARIRAGTDSPMLSVVGGHYKKPNNRSHSVLPPLGS